MAQPRAITDAIPAIVCNVPESVKSFVEAEKAKFVSGEYDASFPFSKGYMRQDGRIVPPGSGRSEIDSMDHYVDGVTTRMQ